MADRPGFDRRSLFKGGLTLTAATALAGLPGHSAAAVRGRYPAPLIYSTDDWEARPPRWPVTVENHRPTYIVVHHTVDPGNTDDFSRERAFWMSRSIQNFHMDTRGWIDSGQQFTNSRGGYITEGRHRSLEILRGGARHVQGANVGGHNSEVIGIENEGLYVDVDVPQALWDSLVELVAYMADQYGVSTANIKGHRDFNSTQCPGDVLYARLPELRGAVADELDVPVLDPPEWPLLKPGDTGRPVLAAQHLLRARGARDVPTDGVFGPATGAAVDRLARSAGVARHTCHAGAHADERGLLGADLWPLLTTTAAPGTGSEAARAAAVLTETAGTRVTTLHPPDWKPLLAN
ncbi:peptidoglycan recognition protein family protein [Amycolatopsis cihanbeyliensis]|uniref:N-acetylmuramoyl-L-alanine amidase n=1 Tax=Amycolatopsis cihanbeyliensis TaxID=1128664 RepID=A0A542DN72_AMYCI|nr:peptidoglycan-binding domain-containing protein [Amycolatopsis cihanbeyliensis]TQJ04536.1 N-acetylmuramoyl-L-alanine amidase [Amycolatopsis cihanbeyliensis]